jgi:hypothetical protein
VSNGKRCAVLVRAGAICFAAFPAVLLVAFGLHFAGEFTPAQALELRLRYVQPSPERFMELFRSDSPLAFVLPHLLVYLALPLLIPGVLALAAPLVERRPRVALTGVLMSLVGIVYMGGVFGSWLSFAAIGRVRADEVRGAVPAVAALIRGAPMLTLTSLLAGLSIAGIVVVAAGLLATGAVPRWQAALIVLGNAMILAFMDIDNLMLVGAALWLGGALPLARARPASPASGTVAEPGLLRSA